MKHFVIIIASAFCTVGQPRQTNPPNVPAPLKSRLGTELELESLVYGTLLSISKAEYGISPFGISVIYKIGPLTEHLSGYGQNVWNRTYLFRLFSKYVPSLFCLDVLSAVTAIFDWIRSGYGSSICPVYVLSIFFLHATYVLSMFCLFSSVLDLQGSQQSGSGGKRA